MAEETKMATFGTSGWEAEEFAQLEAMVKADGVDRSKFLRGLVRKEWDRRQVASALTLPSPNGRGGKRKRVVN